MNGLSWLLYFADVAGNAGVAILLSIIGCAGAAIVFVVAGAMKRDLAQFDRDTEGERQRGISLQKKAGPLLVVIVVLMLAGVLIPSKNTLLLIASSEVGERVLASKDMQNIGGEAGALATDSLKLLRKYVTEQLGEEKAK